VAVPSVSRLSYTPVKGLALIHPQEVAVGHDGLAENRLFYVISGDGRRYELRRDGRLALVVPSYDPGTGRLALRLPDGTVAEGEVALDGSVKTDFYRRLVTGRLVTGPWGEALSTYLGEPVRLVKTDRPGTGVDRERGPVTLISDASVKELARNAGVDRVDDRRFRMLVAVAGCRPHEEDERIGRDLRIGDVVVRVLEQVARCAATTYSPTTGARDLDTLRVIRAYRGTRDKNIDFGICGLVKKAGRIAVGDPVEPL
jgi:uncharacterized protein